MLRHSLFTALATILPFPAALLADTTLDDRLENAEQRIRDLERRIQEQEQSGNAKAAGGRWFDRFELAGLIQVEAAWENPEIGRRQSSLTLATVELGIAAQISPRVSGEITLLYEDDGATPLDVDVAAITLTPGDSWSVTAGQFYLPFGVFETGMISDPLTLELGETRESALQVQFAGGGFGLSAYVFEGDAKVEDETKIDNFGLDLSLAREGETLGFAANLDYINDLGDSDGLIDAAGTYHERVGGMAASLIVTSGRFTLVGEYVAALERFSYGEEPSAYNLEGGYGFTMAGRKAGVAVGVQGSNDAAMAGLPRDVAIATFGIELFEQASLAVEYRQAKDYNEETNRLLTLQLAAEY